MRARSRQVSSVTVDLGGCGADDAARPSDAIAEGARDALLDRSILEQAERSTRRT
jgi:hypothetical protein